MNTKPAADFLPIQEGQIWEDCDPRKEGRTIRITSVDDRYAYAEILTRPIQKPTARLGPTRILRRRMRPYRGMGFRLIKDVSPETLATSQN